MPRITRKRRAPVEDDTSSDDEPSTFFSTRRKCKCPIDACGKLFQKAGNLRDHYRRAHSKKKPYECTFPSCNYAFAGLSELYKHIRNGHHLQSREMAKKYVKEHKKVLAEETKLLGIRCFTGEEMSEEDDSDATVIMPTMPHFTTIHRTSTGHFICPLDECDQQAKSIPILKNHYRVHCGSEYRPYRCIFPDDYCQYAAIQKSAVENHIRVKHFGVPLSIAKWNETGIDDRNESDFIDTRTDWLEIEDALFSNARIVTSSDVQIPRTFACIFTNCIKKFSTFSELRNHFRSHSQLKPFKCSFSNCDHTSTQKTDILRHIQSVHFNVPAREYKNLSKEEKQRAEQYVQVNQNVLDKEEAQIASIRKGSKQSRRRRNCQSTNTGHDNPNLVKIPFEDEETSEDEDDKDKLAPLLAIVQPPNES